MSSTIAFNLRGQGSDSLELDLYEGIGGDPLFGGGIPAKAVLDTLNASPKAKSILVRINSAGGIVTEGLAIYNLLKSHKAAVTCRVDSLAGSIASIIAMAGQLEMAEHSYLMIHNPFGWIEGGSSELRHQADVLDSMREEMISIYCAKSGKSREFIGALMDEETWLTGTQALAYGLCDRMIPDSNAKLAAHFDLSRFKNTPRSIDTTPRGKTAEVPGAISISNEFTISCSDADDPRIADSVQEALRALSEDGVYAESPLSARAVQARTALGSGALTASVVLSDPPTDEPTVTDSPAAIAAASGENIMNEQEYKDKIAALEAAVADLTAKLAGESAARAQAESEAAEARAKAKNDSDDDEDDEEEMAATKAVVAACVALTGEKDLVRLEGAVMALGPRLKGAANAKAARELQVSGLIAKGKLLPAQKAWAMACKPEALSAYLESLGDASVGPAGSGEHTPDDEHEKVVAARAAATAPQATTFDPESVQLTPEEIHYCEVRDGKGTGVSGFKAQFLAQKRELAKAEFDKKRRAAA
jgi:ATP-dependent Clp endopeptidase proteolytic subunit ClpP